MMSYTKRLKKLEDAKSSIMSISDYLYKVYSGEEVDNIPDYQINDTIEIALQIIEEAKKLLPDE